MDFLSPTDLKIRHKLNFLCYANELDENSSVSAGSCPHTLRSSNVQNNFNHINYSSAMHKNISFSSEKFFETRDIFPLFSPKVPLCGKEFDCLERTGELYL